MALPVTQPSRSTWKTVKVMKLAFEHQQGHEWAWPQCPQTLGYSPETRLHNPWDRRAWGHSGCRVHGAGGTWGHSGCRDVILWNHGHRISQIERKAGIQTRVVFRTTIDIDLEALLTTQSQETIWNTVRGNLKSPTKSEISEQQQIPKSSVEWCISSPENKC